MRPSGNGGRDLCNRRFVAVMKMRLFGADDAGHDRVDAHLGRPLHGERLRQVDEPRLGGAIGGGARRRAGRADARDVDDDPPPSLLLHDRVDALGEDERGDEVQLNDRPPKSAAMPWRHRREGSRRRC